MDNTQLKNKILDVLRADERLWDSNKTELNQTLLLDLVEKIDEKVIDTLFQQEPLRVKFFSKIRDVYVFKTNDFKFFMEEHKLDNSYTRYKNRIGLTDGKRFLKDSSDIVLDFPYKDCVLEGGQSNEEGFDICFEYSDKLDKYEELKTKRKEIFFNQVLAQDEIDRLFDKKAFVNWKRYTKNGEIPVGEIKKDGEIIKENLILKGNNLLALHSLKSQFSGKIKLIYIDPPYNTGSDSFSYNDNFNHSTWLTFMKNRLEVAKDLLRDDGVIFVQCDDNEQAFLNVLMSEIFGRNNFINLVAVKAKSSAGASGGGEDKKLKKNYENLIIYSKKDFSEFKKMYESDYLEDIIIAKRREKKSYEYNKILISKGNKQEHTYIETGKGEKIIVYKHTDFEITSIKNIAKNESISEYEVYKKYFYQIFRTQDAQSSIRHKVVKATNKDGGLYSITYIPTSGKNKSAETELFYYQNEMVNFLTNVAYIDGDNIMKTTIVGSLWKDIGWDGIANEGGVKLKAGKKPEKLLKRIIEMATEPNDIVLDYHLGSGTTCAVAHKMGRQYIGIEQMDYGDNDSIIRLQNVVNGDSSGISDEVKWQGGGDFIYCELAKFNDQAKNEIIGCKNFEDLKAYFETLYNKYFLNYNINIKDFKEKIFEEKEFRSLTLEEQKKIFLSMLDLNQMYVCETEMEDTMFNISLSDQNTTKEFYK